MRLLILLALFLDSFNVANAFTNVTPLKRPTTESSGSSVRVPAAINESKTIKVKQSSKCESDKAISKQGLVLLFPDLAKGPKLEKSGDDVSITFPMELKPTALCQV